MNHFSTTVTCCSALENWLTLIGKLIGKRITIKAWQFIDLSQFAVRILTKQYNSPVSTRSVPDVVLLKKLSNGGHEMRGFFKIKQLSIWFVFTVYCKSILYELTSLIKKSQ